MAIQPIDLQTLYSQLENVSKTVASQQQGAQLHAVLQNEDRTKKLQQKQNAVQEAKNEQDASVVKERKERNNNEQQKKGKTNDKDTVPDENASITEVISDPGLGRHIDISG